MIKWLQIKNSGTFFKLYLLTLTCLGFATKICPSFDPRRCGRGTVSQHPVGINAGSHWAHLKRQK